ELKMNSRWGQWESLSRVQFDAALSQKLVRLDKAIQAIFIIKQALKDIGRPVEDDDALTLILPSTWTVDGFDLKDTEQLNDIAFSLKQSTSALEDIARGYSITENIASNLVKEFEYRK